MKFAKRTTKNNILKKVKVKKSYAGLGLFADEDIKEGELIIEYIGKILTGEEADEANEKTENMYLFDVAPHKTIDGSGKDNIARYANHGCNGNAESEIIKERVFLRATQDIQNGEEITFDYGEEFFNEFIKPSGCKCGALVHSY
jgi:hypothetical protein